MTNSYRQDVIANNLANSETVGFKRDLALFQQRPTEAQARGGMAGQSNPLLEALGGGTLAAPTLVDTAQGELAELARERRVLVAVDEAENAASASAAAVTAGSTLGIMVEVDTGMDRCGTDSAADCLAVARQVMDLPGLRFEGITGYEGHCSMTPDHDLRHERQRAAMKFFTDVAGQLEADGIPCPIRSAGGIATWNWTAAYPGLTEIQAGTYVVMDNFHGRMVPGFEHSLTIAATVISRQSGKVIVDAGNKSVADPADVTMVGHDHTVLRFDEAGLVQEQHDYWALEHDARSPWEGWDS